MHQQTSISERRRLNLSPQNVVTQAGNSTTTARAATSSPSSSIKSTPSSTSTASPSSSIFTTFRPTTSPRLPHSTMLSAQRATTSVSASSSSSSFSNISSSRSLITSSTLPTVSISSSIHRLSSSSLVSIFIPRSTTLDHIPQTTLAKVPASSISTSPPSITHYNPSFSSTTLFPAHDFWANKGAVAGTFTAVGLIIIGVVVALAFFFSRSRPGDSKSYESFLQPSTGQLSSGSITPLDAGRLPASLGLSANDLMTQGPVNSQFSNQVHSVYTPYPQDLAPIQERGSEAKMSPSNTVFRRPTVKRDSYQPSIDSFYGAPGT